jgi:F-type H+-transporting ATPase subunit epsilon
MSFQCSVVTPEKAVLEVTARSVVFPAHDGEIGILTSRAPLLSQLGIGPLKVEAEGETHVFMIDGGFAQMVDNKLTILTEQAHPASEIDRDAAREALKAAMGRQASSAEEYEERQKDIQRARGQLKVAS